MAEIIQFPLADDREWLRIADKLRGSMEEANVPEEVIERVLDWHKDFLPEFKKNSQLSFQLKLNCKATRPDEEACNETMLQGFERVQEHFEKFFGEVMLEITSLKVQLESYKHYHPPTQ